MKRLYPIIISISIFFTILISSILISTYDKSFYITQFNKNNTYSNSFVLDRKVNPETIADEVIGYLKNDFDNLNKNNHYTAEEIIHMKDVKNLFSIAKYSLILFIFIILILSFFYLKKNNLYILLTKIGKYFTVSSIAIFVFLYFAMSNFSESFVTFHKLLFTNDYWLLDPHTSIIINIMPEEFFLAHGFNIGKLFIIFAIVLLALILCASYFINKKSREEIKC